MPPVGLRELARQVRRPLVGAGGGERRADRGEMVLEDRDATGIAQQPQPLRDDRGWRPGVLIEHRRDRVGERVELARPALAHILRRLIKSREAMHRRPRHPQPHRDRGLVEPFHVNQPVNLSPIKHGVHPQSSRRDQQVASSISRRTGQTRDVSRIQPAQDAQFSAGVDSG